MIIILISINGLVFSQTNPGASFDALQNYRAGRDLEARNRMQEAMPYYSEAIRLCMDAIAQNRATMDTYTVLTWTLRRQQQYTEVINWGQRALRINNDYRIIETMGEAYFYLYDYERSLQFMQRYVNSLPHGERASVAYFFIGEIYRLQEKFHRADIAYTTAVRLDPGLALWWYRMGTVREALGDYTSAIEAYQQALRRDPNYREARQGLERSRKEN